MKEIGGYFELELPIKKEFHQDAVRLNNGRNGLRYILRLKKPKKLYLPAYICNSVVELLEQEGVAFQFYHIDKNFEIIEDIKLQKEEKLCYVNYFGLKSKFVDNIIEKYYKENVIIDNTQSFFSESIFGVSAFYSARKFFGVSDGGYVYTDELLNEEIPESESYKNYQYLLGRLDINATSFYNDFLSNENRHSLLPIAKMSDLTKRILSSVDYEDVRNIRKRNFIFLHKNIGFFNELNFFDELTSCPMVYPFKVSKKGLKRYLIDNKIFVPTYWIEVLKRVEPCSFEADMTNNLIPLPIDQRYTEHDMVRIGEVIFNFIKNG